MDHILDALFELFDRNFGREPVLFDLTLVNGHAERDSTVLFLAFIGRTVVLFAFFTQVGHHIGRARPQVFGIALALNQDQARERRRCIEGDGDAMNWVLLEDALDWGLSGRHAINGQKLVIARQTRGDVLGQVVLLQPLFDLRQLDGADERALPQLVDVGFVGGFLLPRGIDQERIGTGPQGHGGKQVLAIAHDIPTARAAGVFPAHDLGPLLWVLGVNHVVAGTEYMGSSPSTLDVELRFADLREPAAKRHFVTWTRTEISL